MEIKNEIVKKIIKALNIKIEVYNPTLTEFDHLKFDVIFSDKKIKAMGLYEMVSDTIVINPKNITDDDTLNMTILHEIGHWTGNKERLNRKTLYDNVRRGTEEITAQACYLYLARHYGLDGDSMQRMKGYAVQMQKIWPKLNTRQGFNNGLMAAKYIIGLVDGKI